MYIHDAYMINIFVYIYINIIPIHVYIYIYIYIYIGDHVNGVTVAAEGAGDEAVVAWVED